MQAIDSLTDMYSRDLMLFFFFLFLLFCCFLSLTLSFAVRSDLLRVSQLHFYAMLQPSMERVGTDRHISTASR